MLTDLKLAVIQHSGQFHCSRIHASSEKKVVDFRHLVSPPLGSVSLPPIGRLADFYGTFGSIVFYADEKTGDAAAHIASPNEWSSLRDYFSGWFEDIPDDEREEYLPPWIDTCLVIGEMPRTGNYIVMPTEGEEVGRVFEFDHDGLEFTEQASDLVDYAHRILDLDGSRLTEFASHMRFIEGDRMIQWWIDEMRDNRGNVVSTAA
jgi:hypothetical protein